MMNFEELYAFQAFRFVLQNDACWVVNAHARTSIKQHA